MKKVGYSEVNSGFYKDNKYEESIVNIDHVVADSLDIPNSGKLTVDGKEYLYYNNKYGGNLNTPAWFKSDESVNSADKTPGEKIPAKVYQDKNSEKYYDTENRAINAAGFKRGTDPKSVATQITVDGKTYNQKTGTDAPGYNSGTSAWKNGDEYGNPDIFDAENGWSITIDGKTYYKIKTPKVFEVKQGWYPSSATVNGTKDPGSQATDVEVMEEFSKSKIPQDFPYQYLATTIQHKDISYEIKKGWYWGNSGFKPNGYQDPKTRPRLEILTDQFIIERFKKTQTHNIPEDVPYKYFVNSISAQDANFEVKQGWYSKSAILNGTQDPGQQFTDQEVLEALKNSKYLTTFQYVEKDIPAGNKTYLISKGWYPSSDIKGGYKRLAASSQILNSSVLRAILNNIPSGFKYKYVSNNETPTGKNAQDKWNIRGDGLGIDKTNDEINNLINSVKKNDEKIVINDGNIDTTWTYKAQGDPEASGYDTGSHGWYDDADKLDQNTLSNYYTHKSGPNKDVIFKTKQDIVKEISISNLDDDNQTKTSIIINKSDLGDVFWNWRTTYDGEVLSDDNEGFYALQPQDDNGTDKFNTSNIKYKYLEEFFVDIASLEGKVKSKGWTKVTLVYKKNDSDTYAKNLVEIGINSNQKLPTPTHKGQTIKIDGKVVVAK